MMLLDENIRLATITDKKDKTFTIKCENNNEITLHAKKTLTYESLDELYQTGSLFYFNSITKKVVFADGETDFNEDYEIPKERKDLIE